LSPRAACRLETLGFSDVFDYVAGKEEWLAFGLPTEGDEGAGPIASDVVRRDVVTCDLADRLGSVRERVSRSPYGCALVVSATGVLLGRLRTAALDGDSDATAEQAMEAGPSTVRPDADLVALVERLRVRDLHFAIVTTPGGALVGIVRRADAEARCES
jgi:CBS domain-containing protein